MDVEQKVLIVGAGIGGTALGRALAVRGISFELYERAPEVREVGAGIVMQAGAMLALRSLGLERAAAKHDGLCSLRRVKGGNPPCAQLTARRPCLRA